MCALQLMMEATSTGLSSIMSPTGTRTITKDSQRPLTPPSIRSVVLEQANNIVHWQTIDSNIRVSTTTPPPPSDTTITDEDPARSPRSDATVCSTPQRSTQSTFRRPTHRYRPYNSLFCASDDDSDEEGYYSTTAQTSPDSSSPTDINLSTAPNESAAYLLRLHRISVAHQAAKARRNATPVSEEQKREMVRLQAADRARVEAEEAGVQRLRARRAAALARTIDDRTESGATSESMTGFLEDTGDRGSDSTSATMVAPMDTDVDIPLISNASPDNRTIPAAGDHSVGTRNQAILTNATNEPENINIDNLFDYMQTHISQTNEKAEHTQDSPSNIIPTQSEKSASPSCTLSMSDTSPDEPALEAQGLGVSAIPVITTMPLGPERSSSDGDSLADGARRYAELKRMNARERHQGAPRTRFVAGYQGDQVQETLTARPTVGMKRVPGYNNHEDATAETAAPTSGGLARLPGIRAAQRAHQEGDDDVPIGRQVLSNSFSSVAATLSFPKRNPNLSSEEQAIVDEHNAAREHACDVRALRDAFEHTARLACMLGGYNDNMRDERAELRDFASSILDQEPTNRLVYRKRVKDIQANMVRRQQKAGRPLDEVSEEDMQLQLTALAGDWWREVCREVLAADREIARLGEIRRAQTSRRHKGKRRAKRAAVGDEQEDAGRGAVVDGGSIYKRRRIEQEDRRMEIAKLNLELHDKQRRGGLLTPAEETPVLAGPSVFGTSSRSLVSSQGTDVDDMEVDSDTAEDETDTIDHDHDALDAGGYNSDSESESDSSDDECITTRYTIKATLSGMQRFHFQPGVEYEMSGTYGGASNKGLLKAEKRVEKLVGMFSELYRVHKRPDEPLNSELRIQRRDGLMAQEMEFEDGTSWRVWMDKTELEVEDDGEPAAPARQRIYTVLYERRITGASSTADAAIETHKPYFDEVKAFSSPVHANAEAKRVMMEWYGGFYEAEHFLQQLAGDMDERLERDGLFEREDDFRRNGRRESMRVWVSERL